MLHKKLLNKIIEYKKQFETVQRNIKSFDKLNLKSLQDDLIDKNEHDTLCDISIEKVDENNNESFLKKYLLN